MAQMGDLQEKFEHNNYGLDGWSVKVQEGYRDLVCGLLIKCADISNVVCISAVERREISIASANGAL